ncbi:serine threonine protein kinase [Musa troglodytarum]|uniref:Serine threonine protein kinase n=1 Tax=Musa troglodytarum TaxID=320322 RepID=A0A9E7EYP4_9LILI|nr:serine threonine protein kinase [Musa troglodytarum]
MESKSTGRFTLGRQSSLAPDRDCGDESRNGDGFRSPDDVDADIRLMYLASEGDLEGIEEVLASGVDVNFRDIDGRTALHVAACQGFADVVRLLLDRGAQVGPEDRWGSTPLADAIHYNNHEVIDLLEKHGAKLSIIPMHVKNAREVPEYEIDPSELDFTNSVDISKGTFRLATWRGIRVAVKKYGEDVLVDENKLRAFRDELALFQQIRHPNVVQFLGAVTQSSPMMIVTEYLPKGDLRAYLKRKGALKPSSAVRLALDIARGMNYLHEHKPEAIIHLDLEPSNILRDYSGNLKVADFGVSKLLKVAKTVREERSLTHLGTACRYVAPEVFCNEEYNTKVDVFSFALILQEMIEGCAPFCYKQDNEVPNAYVSKQRPPFGAPPKLYLHGLKELIEECWSENPADRPSFKDIIDQLLNIQNYIVRKRQWRKAIISFSVTSISVLLIVPVCYGAIKMFLEFQGNVEERKYQQAFVPFFHYKLVTLLDVPMRVRSEDAGLTIGCLAVK